MVSDCYKYILKCTNVNNRHLKNYWYYLIGIEFPDVSKARIKYRHSVTLTSKLYRNTKLSPTISNLLLKFSNGYKISLVRSVLGMSETRCINYAG